MREGRAARHFGLRKKVRAKRIICV